MRAETRGPAPLSVDQPRDGGGRERAPTQRDRRPFGNQDLPRARSPRRTMKPPVPSADWNPPATLICTSATFSGPSLPSSTWTKPSKTTPAANGGTGLKSPGEGCGSTTSPLQTRARGGISKRRDRLSGPSPTGWPAGPTSVVRRALISLSDRLQRRFHTWLVLDWFVRYSNPSERAAALAGTWDGLEPIPLGVCGTGFQPVWAQVANLCHTYRDRFPVSWRAAGLARRAGAVANGAVLA